MIAPAAPIVAAYLARGATLWALSRANFALVTAFAFGPTAAWETLTRGTAIAPLVVALTTAIGLVDGRLRGQRALLANLGVAEWTLAAIVAGAATAGELALWATLGEGRPR